MSELQTSAMAAQNACQSLGFYFCAADGSDEILPNYGVGYRWEFKERVNIRLDFGFTRDNPNFTFNINEAF